MDVASLSLTGASAARILFIAVGRSFVIDCSDDRIVEFAANWLQAKGHEVLPESAPAGSAWRIRVTINGPYVLFRCTTHDGFFVSTSHATGRGMDQIEKALDALAQGQEGLGAVF